MCSTLTVRGALEVHTDRKTIRLTSPDLTGVSLTDGQLWFHTGSGRILPQALYRDECESLASFLGFCVFFILDGEDGVTEIRLSSIRAKHRIAIFRPKTNADFTLCTLLYAIESLPLSKVTLQNVARYLYASNPRTGLTRMIRKSCVRLICTAMYMFFDVVDRPVVQCVPQVYVLYKETQRAQANVVAETYFGLANAPSVACVSLSVNERPTRDGDIMGDVAADVLNQTCNVFYVQLDGDRWLSNDCLAPHLLFPDRDKDKAKETDEGGKGGREG